MNRTVVFTLTAALLLVAAMAGCAAARPTPVSITVSAAGQELQLGPADAAFAPVTRQLSNLIAGLDTPLYAYYPPERVMNELLVRPHLEAVYSPTVTLHGKGYEAQAGRLIVVVTDEGPLALTQPREDADWTACEASDTERFSALFEVVREQTEIDLPAPAR